MRHAAITGTGAALPSRLVTNAELSSQLGEPIEAFVEGTLGIEQRWWCTPSESTADLAATAGARALAAAGVAPDEIDLVIIATDTPEFISPPTASVVQDRLRLARAGTFDINAGCAGFVTALDVAWRYIVADERTNRVLVIGAYAMSKFLDPYDKKTVTIFADGAGAVVLEASARPGILASALYADGSLHPGMGVFAGGTREPITAEVLAEGYRNRLRFVRKYPASINEDGWPRITHEVLARAGEAIDAVDWWYWTQVNRSTIWSVMDAMGLPRERAPLVMDRIGYTGSACLPMALDDQVQRGRLRDGDLLVLTGSGAGLAMGAVALRWQGRAQ